MNFLKQIPSMFWIYIVCVGGFAWWQSQVVGFSLGLAFLITVFVIGGAIYYWLNRK